MEKKITSYVQIIKTEIDLIEVHFFNDVTIDVLEMGEILSTIDDLSKGGDYSILWILNEFTYLTMDAIQIRIDNNKKNHKRILSEGIVVESTQNRLLEKYYLNKNKGFYPIVIFIDKESAKSWIKNSIFNE